MKVKRKKKEKASKNNQISLGKEEEEGGGEGNERQFSCKKGRTKISRKVITVHTPGESAQ